ncbi:MAG TPA: SusD/RagB family nutrient-binding outer membrane lipoprotein [Mucilaginibacter sp.]|nr:SusD/RagB family nutrient-binding outer membrane lipoprotein [Mucilaginibacter sp.]
MKTKTIFKRKVNQSLLFIGVLLTATVGCKKGTFDINSPNPNSPSTVPPKYSLSSSLAATASLVAGGNMDVANNWMGYWTQSGAYTPSTVYVIYQLTSSNFTGNFDAAYLNLANYKLLQTTAGTTPSQANYRAISMIMSSFIFQRLVDCYNSVPYASASIVNSKFSYKYDDPATIYKGSIASIDAAIGIIKANTAVAESPGKYDVMFGGNMNLWIQFANTLKLKMLMRQTQQAGNGSLGDAGVKSALSGYSQSDFLGAGQDAAVNPGYSNAANNQLNPFYFDAIANATGTTSGTNQVYWRANSYGVNFYNTHNDPRLTAFYIPTADGKVHGRAYGSTNGATESNSVISAILGTGFNAAGAPKGPTQSVEIIPAFESLFLQAEAIQRGYITGDPLATYNSAVSESFRLLGIPNYAAAATTYVNQADNLTNYAIAPNKLQTLITQKWAACNTFDPLESWSDWRRLGIPTDLPVSIYPGSTATHIPYRLPYPVSETSFNSINVPSGGTGLDIMTSKIFWMP